MFKTMTSALDPKKNPSDDEISKIPSYIFCRWLSGNPTTVFAANAINQFYDIPIENQYHIVKKAFAGKIKFIPYPKQPKADEQKIIEYLCDYFKISTEKAFEYLDMISKKELDFIESLYLK